MSFIIFYPDDCFFLSLSFSTTEFNFLFSDKRIFHKLENSLNVSLYFIDQILLVIDW